MKKIFFNIIIFMALAIITPTVALSATVTEPQCKVQSPKAVTFFASNALLEVEEKAELSTLPDGSQGFYICLPAGSYLDSLFVEVDGENLSSINSLAALPEYQHQASYMLEEEKDFKRKELLSSFLAAEKNVELSKNKIKIIKKSAQIWEKLATTPKEGALPKKEDLQTLTASVQGALATLYADQSAELLILKEAELRFNKAKGVLDNHDQSNFFITLTVKSELKPDPQSQLKYHYMLGSTGMQLKYKVNALPMDKRISLEQNIELSQRSGIDWKDADISVALLDKNFSNRPTPFNPWIMDYQNFKAASNTLMARKVAPVIMDMAIQAKEADFAIAQAAPSPELFEMSSYKLWKLGKNNLLNGSEAKFKLASDLFEADFYYTLRPSLHDDSYLTAAVKYPEGFSLSKARADLFVDEAYIGSDFLSYEASNNIVYLGSDPLVSVSRTEIKDQRGEQGFFNKEQTREWHWTFTAQNKHSWPVDIVIEEVQPISRDESIIIKTQSSPEAETQLSKDPRAEIQLAKNSEADSALKLFVWKFKGLESNKDFIVKYKVNVEAQVGKSLSSSKK